MEEEEIKARLLYIPFVPEVFSGSRNDKAVVGSLKIATLSASHCTVQILPTDHISISKMYAYNIK
jgi:hypothetical protein